jgi:hypothetical protein
MSDSVKRNIWNQAGVEKYISEELGNVDGFDLLDETEGLFVASVVRSGRMPGKGALNASAKELAQKLAVLSFQ